MKKNRQDNLTRSLDVIDEVFTSSREECQSKLKLIKKSIVHESRTYHGEPLTLEIFAFKKSTQLKEDTSRASYKAAVMLKEDIDYKKKIEDVKEIDLNEPEPEQPEAFCQRHGVKMNYKYLRDDIGPRVDRFCWRRNAYFFFRKHSSID